MAQSVKKKNNRKKRKKKVQVLKNNTKRKVNPKSNKKKPNTKKGSNATKKKATPVSKNTVKKTTTKKVQKRKTDTKKNPKKAVAAKATSQKVQHKSFSLKRLSEKAKKRLIILSILFLLLAILLLFPYGKKEYSSEASGKILEVPKFSNLTEECCSYRATFSSIRSYAILKKELEKIIRNYQKLNCDGKTYYYNEEEDFTITEYGINRGFIFNKFYIAYGNGNSCEIDTSLKNIELLPDNYSLENAKRDGSYVIESDTIYNADSYEKFLADVEQTVPTTLRIAKLSQEGDLILIDLQYLENGKYKVIYDGTRDRYNDEDDRVIMAYLYEHIGIYKGKLYAYNGDAITNSLLKTENCYYLFDVEQ